MVRQQALPAAAAVVGIGLLTAACGGSASTRTSVTAPANVRCQTALEQPAASFGSAGGTGTLSVTTARECAWNAVSRSGWVTVTSGAQGQGDGTVAYRVAENVDPLGRQGTLAVGGQDIAVTQEAAPCRFAVSHDAEPLPAAGADALVDVRTHAVCDWTAASDVSWASVSQATGRGGAAVRVNVDPNPGGERSGHVVIADERVAITQHAATTSPPPMPPPTPAPGPAPAPAPSPNPSPSPAPPPDPGPSPVRRVEIEGRIQQLEGSCPSRTFRVGQALVYTTAATRYDDVTCATLRNGMSVEVDGMLMSDGRIRADEIERD